MINFERIFKRRCKRAVNPYTYPVPACKGQRYIISDIHGCVRTMQKLVARLALTADDQLFFLGDFIDKGKNSRSVIDFLIQLVKGGFQIFPLRGNHEDDLLFLYEFNRDYLIEQYIKTEKGPTLFNQDRKIDKNYLEFLNGLPYFFELDKVFLVHGGFDFKHEKPFHNTDEMLWIRNFDYDSKQANNKTIIHGHNPTKLEEIKEKIANRDNIIALDNGCVFNTMEGYGNLLCLNLSSFELIVQENIEDLD